MLHHPAIRRPFFAVIPKLLVIAAFERILWVFAAKAESQSRRFPTFQRS